MPISSHDIQSAQTQLDAHVREIIAWHFSPETGCPFWLDWARQGRLGPAPGGAVLRRPRRQVPAFPGRMAARPAAGRLGAGAIQGPPLQHLRDRRHHRHAQAAHRLGRLQDRLRGVLRQARGRAFPARRGLADGRPDRPAPPAPGHRAPRQLPRQPLLLRRSRPALGEEGHRREEVRPGPRLHGPRRGPGRDPPQAPQDQRGLFTTPKLLEALGEKLNLYEAGIRGVFCGGTTMAPQYVRFIVEEVLEGRIGFYPTYGNTLMGLAASVPLRPEDNFSITYYAPQPRAVLRVVNPKQTGQARGLRRVGPGGTDHADEGVLHAALPRTGRSHPPPSRASPTPGTAWPRCGPLARWRRPLSKGCIEPKLAGTRPNATTQRRLLAVAPTERPVGGHVTPPTACVAPTPPSCARPLWTSRPSPR